VAGGDRPRTRCRCRARGPYCLRRRALGGHRPARTRVQDRLCEHPLDGPGACLACSSLTALTTSADDSACPRARDRRAARSPPSRSSWPPPRPSIVTRTAQVALRPGGPLDDLSRALFAAAQRLHASCKSVDGVFSRRKTGRHCGSVTRRRSSGPRERAESTALRYGARHGFRGTYPAPRQGRPLPGGGGCVDIMNRSWPRAAAR